MTLPDVSTYQALESRYDNMTYNRSGRSGLRLPAISLGLWYNFGGGDSFDTARAMLRRAFDLGVTYFDLANNYGPPPGSAELNFGRILERDFRPYRDELVIATKAGYLMWPGPYGEWGSRKYILSSLDQSLRRMGLDYVDIFYHHRPDPDTPLEESMGALDQAVRSGKALYAGVSNYNADQTRRAAAILRDLGTPFVINQVRYSMFDRWVEPELLDTALAEGVGLCYFSPLAQGMLSDRYLGGIPGDSRINKPGVYLKSDRINESYLATARQLNDIAQARGQSLAQMALAWVMRHPASTTALIGASSVEQVDENVAALNNLTLSDDELAAIETALASYQP